MKKAYGKISNPLLDIQSTYGPGWILHKKKEIEDFPLLSMRVFPEKNHCSLTSLTQILSYYRKFSFFRLPTSTLPLFQIVRDKAKKNFYYFPFLGTFPFVLPSLARMVWASFSYRGRMRNRYFFWNRQRLEKIICEEIDHQRPIMLSFSSGSYRRHTITVFGYLIFLDPDKRCRMYIKVDDHWSSQARYIDLSALTLLDRMIMALTQFQPYENKEVL